VSSSPDRPNVGTQHEEKLRNSYMASGMEPGWTQGEPPSHGTDTDDVRVFILICGGHGLHSTPRERRNVPDIQTALLQYFIYNGGSDERIRRNEDNATAPGHAMNAGVEKPTFGLGIGGNRIHVVHRGA